MRPPPSKKRKKRLPWSLTSNSCHFGPKFWPNLAQICCQASHSYDLKVQFSRQTHHKNTWGLFRPLKLISKFRKKHSLIKRRSAPRNAGRSWPKLPADRSQKKFAHQTYGPPRRETPVGADLSCPLTGADRSARTRGRSGTIFSGKSWHQIRSRAQTERTCQKICSNLAWQGAKKNLKKIKMCSAYWWVWVACLFCKVKSN